MALLRYHLALAVDDGPNHEDFGIFVAKLPLHCILDGFNLVKPIEGLDSHVHCHLTIVKEAFQCFSGSLLNNIRLQEALTR